LRAWSFKSRVFFQARRSRRRKLAGVALKLLPEILEYFDARLQVKPIRR